MSKIYTEYDARQRLIRDLQIQIQILEKNILDYNNQRGCIWFMSIFTHDKESLKEFYIMLENTRDELNKLQTTQTFINDCEPFSSGH
jgi:hypothetical protein